MTDSRHRYPRKKHGKIKVFCSVFRLSSGSRAHELSGVLAMYILGNALESLK